jgi:hypothetical protein
VGTGHFPASSLIRRCRSCASRSKKIPASRSRIAFSPPVTPIWAGQAYDAADAYQAAIDRLKDSRCRARLTEFKSDHLRHVEELSQILSRMGRTPPSGGDMKSILTSGKVVMAGLMGDEAIL